MQEKEIVNRIKDYLKGLTDCFFFKEHGGRFGTAGLPDLIVCYKGRFVALEVKTETGRLTVLQAITLKRIEKAGGIAKAVRSVDEARAVIGSIAR